MTRTLLAALLALTLVGAAPGAHAQDADRIALARTVLVAMKAADTMDAILPTVMSALKPAITKGDAKAGRDWDEVAPAVAAELAATKGEIVDEMAKIYAGAFTADELKALATFYTSPAGRKLVAQTPAIASQSLALGQRWAQQSAGRLGERMRDELRKRGNSI